LLYSSFFYVLLLHEELGFGSSIIPYLSSHRSNTITMPAGDSSDMFGGAAITLQPEPLDMQHKNHEAHTRDLPPVIEGKGTYQDEYLLDENAPTVEEQLTLRRVSAKIPWRVYTVAFVELCERFSYYGTQILFQNYVQRPLLTPTGGKL